MNPIIQWKVNMQSQGVHLEGRPTPRWIHVRTLIFFQIRQTQDRFSHGQFNVFSSNNFGTTWSHKHCPYRRNYCNKLNDCNSIIIQSNKMLGEKPCKHSHGDMLQTNKTTLISICGQTSSG